MGMGQLDGFDEGRAGEAHYVRSHYGKQRTNSTEAAGSGCGNGDFN